MSSSSSSSLIQARQPTLGNAARVRRSLHLGMWLDCYMPETVWASTQQEAGIAACNGPWRSRIKASAGIRQGDGRSTRMAGCSLSRSSRRRQRCTAGFAGCRSGGGGGKDPASRKAGIEQGERGKKERGGRQFGMRPCAVPGARPALRKGDGQDLAAAVLWTDRGAAGASCGAAGNAPCLCLPILPLPERMSPSTPGRLRSRRSRIRSQAEGPSWMRPAAGCQAPRGGTAAIRRRQYGP